MAYRQDSPPTFWQTLIALFEGRRGSLLTLLLAPLLVALALWLPPLSMGDRLLGSGFVAVGEAGGTLTTAEGARLTLPPGALPATSRVRLSTVERQRFIEGTAEGLLAGSGSALPPYLLLKGTLYEARVRGARPASSLWTLPIPADGGPPALLDSYQWDGTRWSWMPSRRFPESGQLESESEGLPPVVALMQAQRVPPQVGAMVGESMDFVSQGQAAGTLTSLSPRLYLVQGDGTIGQLFPLSPAFQQSGAMLIPVLHNVEGPGVVRSDLVDNLLIDPNAWRNHIDIIESLVLGAGYDGIALDYRNVDPSLRDAFSAFVTELGARLTARNRLLVVRVDEPLRVSADRFDTGAYDWLRLGQAATTVVVPLPAVRGSPDEARALLDFTTSQINRYRLALELPAAPFGIVAGEAEFLPYRQVVTLLTGQEAGPEGAALPTVPELVAAGNVVAEPVTGAHTATLNETTIYLEDATTLAPLLALLNGYNISGVVIAGAPEADERLWPLLSAYLRNDLAE